MYCKYCNKFLRNDAWKVPDKPAGFIHKICAEKAGIKWTLAIRRTKEGSERLTRKINYPETTEMFTEEKS